MADTCKSLDAQIKAKEKNLVRPTKQVERITKEIEALKAKKVELGCPE